MKKELKKLADELKEILEEVNDINNFLRPNKTASNPLEKALNDFLEEFGDKDFVLIGALALNSHLKSPRATSDIDLLFKSESDISKQILVSEKFRRTRSHALEHKETGVEIELLTPEFLGVDKAIVLEIINKAKNRIAQSEDLLKLKIESGRFQDIADIVRLVRDNSELLETLKSLPESKIKKNILEELEKETLEERDKEHNNSNN